MNIENVKKPNVFGGSISAEQKREILDFLERHPELKSGKFTSQFTFKTAQGLWIKLSDLLNALPGAKKEWKQWRKTWQDIKSLAKRKNTLSKSHGLETGGGPTTDIKLTHDDEKIIDMIGSVVVERDHFVSESSCLFNFDNDLLDNTSYYDSLKEEIIAIKETEVDTNETSLREDNFEMKIEKNLAAKRKTETSTSTSSQKKQNIGSITPSTSQITEHVEIGTPSSSRVMNKNENVLTSGGHRSKKSAIRVQRLNRIRDANDQLLSLIYNRNQDKAKYSDEKMNLYKRDVEAKESIAKSLELLVDHLVKKKN